MTEHSVMCSRHLISIWLNCWAPQNDSTPLDVPQSWSWGQRSQGWGWSSGAWARLVGYGRHTPGASCDNPPAVGGNRGLDVGEKEKGVINHLFLFWWLEGVRVRASEGGISGNRLEFRDKANLNVAYYIRSAIVISPQSLLPHAHPLSQTQGGGPYEIKAQQSVVCYVLRYLWYCIPNSNISDTVLVHHTPNFDHMPQRKNRDKVEGGLYLPEDIPQLQVVLEEMARVHQPLILGWLRQHNCQSEKACCRIHN